MNLPNKITVVRLLLVPVFIALFYYYQYSYIAGIIFTIAALSDFLDGYLARKNNQITTFGKFMDPLADKILVVSAQVLLLEEGVISALPVIVTVYREFAVSGYRLIAATHGKTIAAGISGKIKTVTQMIGIVIVLFTKGFPALDNIMRFGVILIDISAVIAVISLIIYIKQNSHVLSFD